MRLSIELIAEQLRGWRLPEPLVENHISRVLKARHKKKRRRVLLHEKVWDRPDLHWK